MAKLRQVLGLVTVLSLTGVPAAKAGMSEADAKALAADLLLIKFEVGIEHCANLGAKNMQKLYDAYRSLQGLRADFAPQSTNANVVNARASYKTGLSALPAPDMTEADHIAVLCDRTLEKMQGFTPEYFTRMVDKSARSYQQLFAQGS
ncbi:hypothetical protein L1F30_10835 [Simiduia sp. 21SJ11W-1]|uniref:hypothetical protein n=1 Tax=Simiduia sp. 21SJ11W-1 TaxID=2909669 RepID=UPI00209FF342|nr:hypothetical protein [Simiduia sp. 21SJ11W-1]UTA46658.1 hypothetical protein L1F30_10835 [Simiduia sp. 21SJ11W-1]